MENKDLKYNTVLDQLRKAEVILDDAERLTDSIMQRVEQTTARAGRVRMMRISGIISSVAASALICLFVYETLKYSVSPSEKYSGTQRVSSVKSMYPYQVTELSIEEKEKFIKNVIKRKEAQRAQKERLSASFNILSLSHHENE